MRRHSNGEGSVVRRSDGRWAGAYYATLTDGRRKRVWLYGKSRREVQERLRKAVHREQEGVRTPPQDWKVGVYLDEWLRTVVLIKNSERTHEHYARIVRLYIQPVIGGRKLRTLSVSDVQRMINGMAERGVGSRTIGTTRAVLRAALSRAEAEELTHRNVARLVAVPADEPRVIVPWTALEASQFLVSIRSHRWFLAYLLSLVYGLRRGEVLGLRWGDIDVATGVIHIRQQLQRTERGLVTSRPKTRNSRRDLPLVQSVVAALAELPAGGPEDLVFRTEMGGPIDPKNYSNTFLRLSEQAGLRRIRLHDARHTAATMLKLVGVQPRDAQLILGHAHVSTTQQIYQHGDVEVQRKALGRLDELLSAGVVVKKVVRRTYYRVQSFVSIALTPGGPGGTRTLDTLLKRSLEPPLFDTLTSVLRDVRVSSYVRALGHVVVNNGCQIGRSDDTCQADAARLIHLIDELEHTA